MEKTQTSIALKPYLEKIEDICKELAGPRVF